MLIPLGTDRPLHRATVVTWALIAVNIALFAVEALARAQAGSGGAGAAGWPVAAGGAWLRNFTLTPDADPWWSIFGYAFRHGGLLHLAGNMLFLWVFGPNIEDRFGRLGFLAFYLLGAAAGGGLHILFEESSVVGASGAIAACTGAYLVMFPLTLIRVFSLIFVIGLVQVPAWWFIGLSVVWDLLAQSSGGARAMRIAHLAHLGGYGFGMLVAFTLLWTRVMPREPYDVFSMVKQKYRRRQIRSAAIGQEKAVARHWEKHKPAPGGNGAAKAAEATARAEALASARAEVSHLVSSGDLPGAAAAYKQLAERFPVMPGPGSGGGGGNGAGGEEAGRWLSGGSTVLSRRHQYELANHYFTTGDQGAAVYAYERFLEAYPRDPEAPSVRLLLGKVNARYLNDPVRARALLTEAIAGLREESARDMARKELEALG